MNKKVKILIIISILILVLLTIFSLSLMRHRVPRDLPLLQEDNTGIKNENKEKEITEIKLEVINLERTEKEVRKLISQFKFYEANEHLTLYLNSIDREEALKNEGISNLYYDLPILCKLEEMSLSNNKKLVRDSVLNLLDIENFVIATLWLDDEQRNYILQHEDSLNPIFWGDIEIESVEEVTMEDKEYKRLRSRNKKISVGYKAHFNIGEDNLIAYISEVEDGSYVFEAIIEEVEGSTIYYTKKEWEDIYKIIQENLGKEGDWGGTDEGN